MLRFAHVLGGKDTNSDTGTVNGVGEDSIYSSVGGEIYTSHRVAKIRYGHGPFGALLGEVSCLFRAR